MSRLTAITVQNYRCFPERTTLELRPLTLLYGWNDAGKSALLRVLPLLCESLEEGATGPLELRGEAGRGSSFRELLWRGAVDEAADNALLIALHFRDAPLSCIEYRIDEDRDSGLIFIKSLQLFGDNPEQPVAAYARGQLAFPGLVPGAADPDPRLQQVRALLVGLRGAVQWIGSVRQIRRTARKIGARPRRLSCSGVEAPDYLRLDPTLREEVSAWYRANFGKVLAFKDLDVDYRVMLEPERDASREVALVDSGEGLLQLLPVVTAVALLRRASGPRILAIEEAESHLHPNAQRAVAELLCTLVNEAEAPWVVLETHSQVLLLEVQLQLASRVIKPDQVLLTWIEQEDGRSTSTAVTFDASGQPVGKVLEERFTEADDLAREVLRRQRGRA